MTKLPDSERAIKHIVSIYNEAINFQKMTCVSTLESWAEEGWTVVQENFMLERFRKHIQTCRFCIRRKEKSNWCTKEKKYKIVGLEDTCHNFEAGGTQFERFMDRIEYQNGK
jgi:hypothetical protein